MGESFINKAIHADCFDILPQIPDASVDVILTDPPYGYLCAEEHRKWDTAFDEPQFFAHCRRVLRKDGWLAFFGRGASRARWEVECARVGFKFKEEVVWYKNQTSSPVAQLGRVHELINVFNISGACIRKVRRPLFTDDEDFGYDARRWNAAYKTLCRALSRAEDADMVQKLIKYIASGKPTYQAIMDQNHKRGRTLPDEFYVEKKNSTAGVTIHKESRVNCYTARDYVQAAIQLMVGIRENSVMYNSPYDDSYCNVNNYPEAATNSKGIELHATPKPVGLLRRLLNIMVERNTGVVVLDPFMGGGSTCCAALSLGHKYIGIELNERWYKIASARIANALALHAAGDDTERGVNFSTDDWQRIIEYEMNKKQAELFSDAAE
jgi:DNA modification methylase